MSETYAFVALQEIWHGGVRAYNPGDFVPADNVQANNYEVGVQVAKRGSEAAEQAETDPPGEAPPAAPGPGNAQGRAAKPAKSA